MKTTRLIILTTFAALLLGGPSWGQSPEVQERVAALKKALQEDQAKLKHYEWIETTVVSVKGKEVSRTQNRNYWGADGKLQKVPVAPPEEPKKKRGLRGRVVEKKKEEMTDYMKSAVALVKLYVPPDPNRIQVARDAGKASVQMIQPGKRVRLDFRDYRQPGDLLGIEIDLTNNHLLGLKVATYLADPKDAVTLDVKYAVLKDGTGYPAQAVLDARAKNIKVTVENSGYRPIEPDQKSPEKAPVNS
jgi:hypothetical protein